MGRISHGNESAILRDRQTSAREANTKYYTCPSQFPKNVIMCSELNALMLMPTSEYAQSDPSAMSYSDVLIRPDRIFEPTLFVSGQQVSTKDLSL